MQKSALFDKLIIFLRTTTDASAVDICLQEFVDTFFTPKKLEEQQQIFRKLPKNIANLLISTFATAPITPENQIQIKREIDELVDKLRTCKNIQMTIAFQPNDETITYFSDWVKNNVSKELLIDLRFDKSIVGGAIIIAGGAYKDYSVKKNLSNRFQIQRDDIMGLLE